MTENPRAPFCLVRLVTWACWFCVLAFLALLPLRASAMAVPDGSGWSVAFSVPQEPVPAGCDGPWVEGCTRSLPPLAVSVPAGALAFYALCFEVAGEYTSCEPAVEFSGVFQPQGVMSFSAGGWVYPAMTAHVRVLYTDQGSGDPGSTSGSTVVIPLPSWLGYPTPADVASAWVLGFTLVVGSYLFAWGAGAVVNMFRKD